MTVSLPEKQAALSALPHAFPELHRIGFALDDVTSPATPRYNCIGYAAKDETQRWWPLPHELGGANYYWPESLPREHPPTVDNFFKAFETLGFMRCKSSKHEIGYEKVAIFVDATDIPTHMARELGDGVWFSKVGIKGQDIRHYTLEALEDPAPAGYGKAKYFMRKPLEGYTRWKRIKGKIQKILSGSKTLLRT